jgi:hypothetical protein
MTLGANPAAHVAATTEREIAALFLCRHLGQV